MSASHARINTRAHSSDHSLAQPSPAHTRACTPVISAKATKCYKTCSIFVSERFISHVTVSPTKKIAKLLRRCKRFSAIARHTSTKTFLRAYGSTWCRQQMLPFVLFRNLKKVVASTALYLPRQQTTVGQCVVGNGGSFVLHVSSEGAGPSLLLFFRPNS